MICKITKKKIKPIMSFGKMPIANGFINKQDFEKLIHSWVAHSWT